MGDCGVELIVRVMCRDGWQRVLKKRKKKKEEGYVTTSYICNDLEKNGYYSTPTTFLHSLSLVDHHRG